MNLNTPWLHSLLNEIYVYLRLCAWVCWSLYLHVSPQTVRWGTKRNMEVTAILCRRNRWEETVRVKMREGKIEWQLKIDRQRSCREELGKRFPDKVTVQGRLSWVRSWSMADTAEAGVGGMSRVLSIKPLKGCPAKHCYKRVMTSIFSLII